MATDNDPRVHCQCRPQWFVDWQDDRGETPVTHLVAAHAMDAGFQAWLGKTCQAWSKRPAMNAVWCERTHGLPCSVCGWPYPIDGVTGPSLYSRRWPRKPHSWRTAMQRRVRQLEGAGR